MSTAVGRPPVPPGRRLSLSLLAVMAAYLALTWWFGGDDTVAAARRIGLAWVLAASG